MCTRLLEEYELRRKLMSSYQRVRMAIARLIEKVEPLRGPDSVLLDESDSDLKNFDCRLRRSLATGWPYKWTPLPEVNRLLSVAEQVLIQVYQGIHLSYVDKWDESMHYFRQIGDQDTAAHLKGRALGSLVQMLYIQTLSLRGEKRNIEANDSERECRERCESVFNMYGDYPWSRNITYVAHAALGILDYHAGELMTAMLHLKKAREEYAEVHTRYDRHITTNIGFIDLYLGHRYYDEKRMDEAQEHYEAALGELDEPVRPSACAFLASILLTQGKMRKARGLLLKALRRYGKVIKGRPVADELKCHLAAANVSLGRKTVAVEILRDVVLNGVDEQRKAYARKLLGTLQ